MQAGDFSDYVVSDLLRDLGGLSARRMFGGVGLYQDGVFFGIVSDDRLYLKVGPNTEGVYRRLGSKPFWYQRDKDKTVTLSYWEVPAEVLEDRELLARWACQAVQDQLAAQSQKRTRSKNRTP